MSEYLIRRIPMAHCKRGPARCAKCREAATEMICLLDVDPPDRGMIQRRVIEIGSGPLAGWREFDVTRVFEDARSALDYARENGISDVET